MERVTSRQNSLCTHLRKLAASAAYRRRCGEFLCDSPKLLEEALLWQGELHTVVATERVPLPPLPESVRCVEVPADVMESISPAQSPQGVLAVCGLPERPLPPRLEGRRYVVLDGVQDPACADWYGPKTVRASMGAVFRCPTWACGGEELKALLADSGLPLYGAALRADTADVRTVDFTRCAVAIGSEGRGLSQTVLDLCSQTVRIPMSAHCESLNAAAAATVLLWEAARND